MNKKGFNDSVKKIDNEINKREIGNKLDGLYNKIMNGNLVNSLELYDFFLHRMLKVIEIKLKTKKASIDAYAGKSALWSDFRKMIDKEGSILDIFTNRYVKHRRGVGLLLSNIDPQILIRTFESPSIVNMIINPIRGIQLITSLLNMIEKLEKTFITTSKTVKRTRINDYDVRYHPEPGFVISMYLLTLTNRLFIKRASIITVKYPLIISENIHSEKFNDNYG
jgi:hypothetical protein